MMHRRFINSVKNPKSIRTSQQRKITHKEFNVCDTKYDLRAIMLRTGIVVFFQNEDIFV